MNTNLARREPRAVGQASEIEGAREAVLRSQERSADDLAEQRRLLAAEGELLGELVRGVKRPVDA